MLTLTASSVLSPITLTRNSDFLPSFIKSLRAISFPAVSSVSIVPTCGTTAKDLVFSVGEQDSTARLVSVPPGCSCEKLYTTVV